MQDLVDLDGGVLLAIASITLATISMILAWINESRQNRRATAMDAVANRFLPFYSIVIEGMTKLNLFMMMYQKISFSDLNIDTQMFHERAGESFVYMRENESRQLAINTIQILEAISLQASRVDSMKIAMAASKALPLLGLLKDHIESYLASYSNALNVPSPDTTSIKEMAEAHAESTLLEIVQLDSE